MKKIVLFDPSIRSLNKGDEIIMRSAEEQLSELLKDAFAIKSGTHTPAVTIYQNDYKSAETRFYLDADFKFICGSNLMWKSLWGRKPILNINPFNCKPYYDSILMGVGLGRKKQTVDSYTRHLYKKVLSNNYIHSTRDDETKQFVESLGFRAINTGCPTTWKFTPQFCKGIASTKSDTVIFTLTDYLQNKAFDQKMIDILLSKYKHVYFWIQGAYDLAYFQTLTHTESIRIIEPSVEAFNSFLSSRMTDYIGTRLHAGMYALQHKRRAIIVAIDNRTTDMGKSYHMNIINRDEIEGLEQMIEQDLPFDFGLNESNIQEWMSQFLI